MHFGPCDSDIPAKMIEKMLPGTCDVSASGPKNTFVMIKWTSIRTDNMNSARSRYENPKLLRSVRMY